MPLDPTIPLSFKFPETPSPVHTIGGLMQMRGQMAEIAMRQAETERARQQTADFQAQTDQRNRDLGDQQRFQRALQANSGDWAKTFDEAERGGTIAPQNLLAYRTKHAETVRAKSLLDAEELKNHNTRLQALGSSIAGVMQLAPDARNDAYVGMRQRSMSDPQLSQDAAKLPPTWDDEWGKQAQWQGAATQDINNAAIKAQENQRAREKQDAEIPGIRAKSTQEQFATAAQTVAGANDPASWASWRAGLPPEVQAKVPAEFSAQNKATVQRMGISAEKQPEFDINSYKARIGLMGNSEYDQFLAQYARSLGKTPADLTPEEGLHSFQKYAELKQDPVLRQNAIELKDLQASMLRLQQGQMPTEQDYKTMARAVLNHSLAPQQFQELKSGSRSGVGAKVFSLAMQMDPNFSMQRADSEFKALEKTEADFTSGREATLVRSNNNALEHLGLLDQAREALHNGDVQRLNAIANWLGVEVGSDKKTVFDHIGARVADEVTKSFIPGGGGQSERMAAAGGYSSRMSDDQLRSNIRADIHLMDSQQRNLMDQYKRGTYGQGGQQLFTPGAMATRDRVLGNAAQAGPKKDDTRQYAGHTYKFDGHEWVMQ